MDASELRAALHELPEWEELLHLRNRVRALENLTARHELFIEQGVSHECPRCKNISLRLWGPQASKRGQPRLWKCDTCGHAEDRDPADGF